MISSDHHQLYMDQIHFPLIHTIDDDLMDFCSSIQTSIHSAETFYRYLLGFLYLAAVLSLLVM